jgi:hypothetical protein
MLLLSDDNECVLNVCPHNSVCVNTPGSYTCGCQAGFHLSGANTCEGKRVSLQLKLTAATTVGFLCSFVLASQHSYIQCIVA